LKTELLFAPTWSFLIFPEVAKNEENFEVQVAEHDGKVCN
jgi:hypothetical protein